MRNMISQVRNSNRWLTIGFTALVVIALSLSGCKEKNNPINPSLKGNISKPTTWVAPEPGEYDPNATMTTIVSVRLSLSFSAAQLRSYQPDTDDMLTAFSDNECVGVGVWVEDYNAYWLFISAPSGTAPITLKYYSAKLKNIFVSTETFPFVNDATIGTPSEPSVPLWQVASSKS